MFIMIMNVLLLYHYRRQMEKNLKSIPLSGEIFSPIKRLLFRYVLSKIKFKNSCDGLVYSGTVQKKYRSSSKEKKNTNFYKVAQSFINSTNVLYYLEILGTAPYYIISILCPCLSF